ncbi:hypothetical protein [Nonomuraea sp. NPDC049709]|uniref:hypothetical protein n=1 Tax=Nonomuraea sp. NPDC049709 TaxID=3154736 RepID=UPI00342014BC
MCLSCGCGEPNDDHGNAANITAQDLQSAAQAADISPQEVVENIQSGVRTG